MTVHPVALKQKNPSRNFQSVASMLVIALSSVAMSCSADAQSSTVGSQPVAQGVAVVELFTSQGCNSCPPADDALRSIQEVAQQSNLPIYVLSFHVDYWNRLGWRDPYSDASYTQRQHNYASAIRSNRVYTPQMIVGGTSEFVGSSRRKAFTAIKETLQKASTADIQLSVDSASASNQLSVRYDVKGDTRGRVLHVALVETPRPNRVPRGENSGRELAHVNVVRDFTTVSLSEATGTVTLDVPDNFTVAGGEVVAYVQNPRSLEIGGATSVGGLALN